MSNNVNALLIAALTASNNALAAVVALNGGEAAATTGTAAATSDAPKRGRPSNASKAENAAPKLTNEEVAAIVTKIKDHPKGNLAEAKALIAEVGAKKIADIKDQPTLQKLKDLAEAKLAELDGDDDGGAGDEEL